jgi:acid phosphatase
MRILLCGSLALAVSACIDPPSPGGTSAIPATYLSSGQPLNVGDAKRAATTYHDNGTYARDLEAVVSEAGTWLSRRAPQVSRPALVLDIDDTSLSNWEVIRADDFGRVIGGPCSALPEGPCGWAAWDLRADDPVIAPTLRLFREARALGVTVLFITGRPEAQRAATERNLHAAGYDGYAQLYMVPDGARYASAATFKAPLRAQIERSGYTIIANMGDQPSDLEGGHAERVFLLPNPFYRIP